MGHGHGGGHRRPLATVLAISATILVLEVVGAALSGSLALLADAGHLFTDVAGLSLALVAAVLTARPATDARTWGYRRADRAAHLAAAAGDRGRADGGHPEARRPGGRAGAHPRRRARPRRARPARVLGGERPARAHRARRGRRLVLPRRPPARAARPA